MLGGGIENWFAYVLALLVPAGPAAGPVRREASSSGCEVDDLPRERPVQDQLRAPTRRSSRSCRTGSFIAALLVVRVRRGAAARQRVPAARDPDPVPDPGAGRASGSTSWSATAARSRSAPAPSWRSAPTPPTTSASASRACRWSSRSCSAGCARRLVGVLFGLPSACASRAFTSRSRPWRRSSSSTGCSLRVQWFTNYSSRARSASPALQVFGLLDRRRRRRSTCFCLAIAGRVRAAGEEPGARPHRPRVDGDPRHGRRRRDDRHPPAVRQAHRPSRSARSSSAWPARCGRFVYSARGSRWPSTIDRSFQLLFMVIIGGLGSILGSFFGAAFIVDAADLPRTSCRAGSASRSSTATDLALELMVFGALIVFFLIVEPHGLARLWRSARRSCGCGRSRIDRAASVHRRALHAHLEGDMT